ncbi:FAD-dependent oxidoreductase [Aeromicrobium sp.]|uniref:FAD-dependent oxidoreductase n=1 Tax=Aeromicrobium sp. TaxID=1871063 RepID=UPI0025B933F4|nr:FAD-dependent oxidoreductase [Aeromicrobium sp.]MCK5892402.1 NAD(P)/FAD-dependent oxidoreductase [Aeromicrobium sp.]
MRTVVIGNGMAAVALVERLVEHGVSDVTVLGEETCTPYNRILLSAVLEGSHRPGAISLRSANWYAAHAVDLRLGAGVVAIHRSVQEVELADGERVPYDRLVLAIGSVPELPPIRGLVDADGVMDERVHAFRTLADCDRLIAAASASSSALIVGGGLLGLQVARALSVRGMRAELVEVGDHVLRRQVDPQAGRILARSLEQLGTAVYVGVRATRLTPSGLRLDNGYELDADLVVLTAGSRPRIRLANAAGLVTARGVVVDDTLATSDPRIFAIGDCAEHSGRTPGLVPPAWEQARILGDRFAGSPATYTGHRTVARLRATDLDVAVLGEPETAQGEVVEVSNPVTGTHKKLVVDGGVVVAATLVGDLSRVGLITQAFDQRTVLAAGEPGELLMTPRPSAPPELPDDAEVCACAGVSVGRVRACSSLEELRETTRATTGCGGCLSTCTNLLSQLVKG